jgi:hypothetical protein
MPFRSMKMNFFICGFQRRVWCPKCTPASSRSFITSSATTFLLWGCIRRPAVVHERRPPQGTPRSGRGV